MRPLFARFVHPLLTVLSLGLVATLAVFAMVIAPQHISSAHAAIPIGPGYQIPNPYRDSIIGGYVAADGSILYCLDWGKESPTGPNDAVLSIESTAQYNNWSHLEIARVNYIITRWGQTADNDQAAAVAMAIWMRHPGTPDPFFSEHRFVKATIPDAQRRASIAQRAAEMNAAADGFTPFARAAIGSVTITPDTSDRMAGTISIAGVPAQAQGTLQLSGAVVELTESNSVAGVQNGDTFRYRASPTDEQFGSFVIDAQVLFVTPGGPGDELVVWRTPDSFQNLGQASSVIPDFQFELEASHEMSVTFVPELTTQAAEQLVLAGEPLVDTVQFSLAEGSHEWRQLEDGTFLELTAWCQAFGPLSEEPAVSDLPPPGSPTFGDRIEFEVGGTLDDPLDTVVDATVERLPTRGGHYTFVCGIDQESQASLSTAQSLPIEYAFQHEFGLVPETVVVTPPLAKTGAGLSILALTMTALGVSAAGLFIHLGARFRRHKTFQD